MKTLTFLDRPQLATSALKKGLQLADDLIEHLFEEDHSMHKVKVKVNCTLVQALRLCTVRTAHRGSRGVALLFHDHGTRRG
jgi:hypothetical protein